MNQLRRYYVVSPAYFDELQRKSASLIPNKLSSLDSALREILANAELSQSQKWLQYRQLLIDHRSNIPDTNYSSPNGNLSHSDTFLTDAFSNDSANATSTPKRKSADNKIKRVTIKKNDSEIAVKYRATLDEN